MSHNFRENNEVYQGFIMSQVILEIPCFEAYKSTCKIRKEVVNYRDFEFIYMKFAGGHTELNVVVPEWTENDLTLLQMPPFIFNKVSSSFDVKTRLLLRKVSKTLKQTVDDTAHHCKYFGINLFGDYLELDFDTYEVRYHYNSQKVSSKTNGIVTEYYCQNPFEEAMTDLQIIMKNLTIEFLGIVASAGEEAKQLMRTLQQVHRDNQCDFRVTKLSIGIGIDTFKMLPLIGMMNPSFLKEVRVDDLVPTEQIFPGIYEMDQGRNLKKFVVDGFVEFDLVEAMTQLNHFKVATSLTVEQAQQLIQTLSISATFEKCKITCYASIITVAEFARAMNVTVENDEIVEFSHRIEIGNNGGALLIKAKREQPAWNDHPTLFLRVEREI